MATELPRLRSCPPHELLARIGDKWTVMVLVALSLAPDNRLRFSELKQSVVGISQRMLTSTVRALERDGLLLRHYFAEVPPRVEYQLTARGQSILPFLSGLIGWIGETWPEIQQSRAEYDAR
jgi:DNA-binding HxlR family transcriptional regulator